MVHTAELIKSITEEEYRYLMSFTDEIQYRNKALHIYTLAEFGITDINPNMFILKFAHSPTYYCKVIINLARLSNDGKQEYKLFTDQSDTGSLYENFSKYMSCYLPHSSDLKEWTTRRIDYTVDIRTPLVEAHIQALQRGRKPPTMTMADNNQHKKESNRRHFKGSVRYHNKSTIINIYDKHFERECKQQERGYTDTEELEKCKDILRIEVQCLKSKTNYIKAKEGFCEKELKNYLCSRQEIENILLRAYTQIAGKADFYPYDRAKSIIKNANIKKRTKEYMCIVLDLINGRYGTKSVWKAEQKYTELYPKGISFKTILTHFEKIGLNPVTIPKDIDLLPNLGSEIALYFTKL